LHSLENERFIRQLLIDKSDSSEISRDIVRHLLIHTSTRGEDLITHFGLLISLGNAKDAIEFLEGNDWDSAHAPIALLISLINRLNLENPIEEEIAAYLKQHSRMQTLIFANPRSIKSPRLKEQFMQIMQSLVKQNEQRFGKLVEQLEFYKNQRMWKDQREVIQKLLQEFPENKKTKEFQKTFNEIWAMEKIEQVLLDRMDIPEQTIKPNLSAAELEMLDVIFASASELVVTARYLPTDFALMFHFFEAPQIALEFLKTDIKPLSHLWLEAELLFICGRYVDVLLVLKTIHERAANDPETQFSVSYLRAQCFWKLGQRDRAKELINDILRVRPDYRSAKSLQIDWNSNIDE